MAPIALYPGANVRITMTKQNEVIQGHVHALDEQSQTLVLRMSSSSTQSGK